MDYKNLIKQKVVSLQRKSKKHVDDGLFSDLYHLVSKLWERDRVKQRIAHKYRLSEDEAFSIMLDKLYDTCLTFSDHTKDYYNFLSVSINNTCKNLLKQRYRQLKRLATSDVYSMDEDPHLVKSLPHANAVDEEIDLKQKESEQRQLLTDLLEKADDKCRQAVIAFSKSSSFYEASKLLGIDNETVKRRVRNAAKHFDENKHGCIYDYFAVLNHA